MDNKKGGRSRPLARGLWVLPSVLWLTGRTHLDERQIGVIATASARRVVVLPAIASQPLSL